MSVNVSVAREVPLKGGVVSTGICEVAVPRRVPVRATGLEGDEQADRRAHGGPRKTGYGYPGEHYALWLRELARTDLAWGALGRT